MSEDLVRLKIADGDPPWAPSPSANRAFVATRSSRFASRPLRASIDWRGLCVTALVVFVIIAIWSVVP